MQDISAYKEVSIKNLPNCYAKECLSNMVTDQNLATVNVVAVVGYVKDWSAYIGFPDFSFINEENKEHCRYYCYQVRDIYSVASNGDKLDERSARIIFPEYKDLKYRR